MEVDVIELSSDEDGRNDAPGNWNDFDYGFDSPTPETGAASYDIEMPEIGTASGNFHRMSDSEPEDEGINRVKETKESITVCTVSPQSKVKKKNVKSLSPQKLLAKSKSDQLKEERKKERELKKILKEIKDAEKAARAEAIKRKKHYQPGDCLKHMTIVVEKQLSEMNMFLQTMQEFPLTDVKFALEDVPTKNSIQWKRLTFEGEVKEESYIIVVWVVDELVQSIKDETLALKIESIKESSPGKRLVLWIFTLDQYYRKSKLNLEKKARKEQNPNDKTRRRKSIEYLSRDDIELMLTRIQIVNGVDYRSFNTAKELTELLQQYTKAVAEAPYKREKAEIDNRANFLLKGDNRDCVRVDKDLNGLSQLWMKQLTQFSLITPDTSRTIVLHYPTPTALFKAYEECEDNQERRLLLQDLVVKRSNAVNAAGRRLGPELSKKISWLFAPPLNEDLSGTRTRTSTGAVLREIKL